MANIQAFDFSVNLLRAIIWQYDKAPNLVSLVQSKQDWYAAEHSEFWQAWLRDVFDLRTANEFGLAVWAIILDVPLFASNGASPPAYPAWGFDPYGQTFTHGNFAAPGAGVVLPVEERRAILRLRYHQLTTDGTVTGINAALADVFGVGACYVIESGALAITFNFVTPISAPLQVILQSFDVLPRPAGVAASIVNPI